MKDALDPSFDPDSAEEMTVGADKRKRTRSGEVFCPHVKIQLLTTSDGKKLGGIRLDLKRPLVRLRHPHAVCAPRVSGAAPRAQVHADRSSNPDCNKRKFGSGAYCRKHKCLVDGYNEVDKLKKSIDCHKRELTETWSI